MERRPDPPPLRTDDVRTVVVGTAAWAVALAAGLVLGEPDVAWTALAGLLLGFVGIAYMRRRAAAIAREEGPSHFGPGAPEA